MSVDRRYYLNGSQRSDRHFTMKGAKATADTAPLSETGQPPGRLVADSLIDPKLQNRTLERLE